MGYLGSFKVIGNVTIKWTTHDFVFISHRNYTSILYDFDIPYTELSVTSYRILFLA